MVVSTAPLIVGVRFQEVGKLYHFDSSAYPEVTLGDYVIVETSRGRQLGQVMGLIPPEKADLPRLKPIKRPASARDLVMKKLYEAKEIEALILCREAAAEIGGLEAAKFVRAEYSYDGSSLAFVYTAEENVDVSRLRKRLSREFRSARVEMRRIGARDAAKLLGEYGACGSPRCCSTHLTEFSPVSIKMAKDQGISLNPSEITGMCGRLRCCLVYEYEQYVEAKKGLPKLNKIVVTPHGEGKVIEVNPLKGTATVVIEGNRYELTREQLEPSAELHALQEKAARGCAKEGLGGVCDCGARTREGVPAEVITEASDEATAEAMGTPLPKPPESIEQPSAAPRPSRRTKRRRSRRGRAGNLQ